MAEGPTVTDAPAVGRGRRLGVVVADYHEELAGDMLRRAEAKAKALDFSPGPVVRVPGTYDTPLPAKRLLAMEEVAGVVVIGVIVTGETRHDELIGHATAKALTDLSLEFGKPVGLAITGPGQTMAQAKARVDRADHAVVAVARALDALDAL